MDYQYLSWTVFYYIMYNKYTSQKVKWQVDTPQKFLTLYVCAVIKENISNKYNKIHIQQSQMIGCHKG